MDATRADEDEVKVRRWFSNDLINEVLLILTIILITIFIQRRRKKELRNFPSGPTGIPILGYIPFLGSNSHLTLHEIGKKYGGMFSIQLGYTKFLVLANYSSIKEAFANNAFLGRPDNGNFAITENHTGYVDQNGEIWKEQRFFCQKVLQDLGSNSACAENLLTEEILYLLENIKNRHGEPIHIEVLFHASISNCISQLLYGKRYDYSDPLRHRIDKSLRGIVASAQLVSIFNCLPFGNLLRRLSSTYMEGVRDQFFLYNFFRNEVAHSEKRLDENTLQYFVDFYLSEVKKSGRDSEEKFTRESLVGNMWLYSAAAYDTLGTSMQWLFLAVAKFTDVQDKVQKEIDNVIGKGRQPTWNDRYMMPYTRAVITEMQRWKTVVPKNLCRATTEDTKLQGFDIPKGTPVVALLHSAHHDTDYWTNPEEFRPERFISEDGKSFVAKDAYIPFSFGRRGCPAKIFASIAVFFYFTLILQRFRVKSGESNGIKLEGTAVITNTPKSQKLSFVPLEN